MTVDLATGRRERAARAMAGAGLDAFVVGQPRNLTYLTGARRVLVRGSRSFAPLAVLRADGEIWMQSSSAGDIPAALSGNLYPQTWDPQNLVGHVAGILGAGARRIGVDSMTPAWRARLAAALPSAELVQADGVLRAVRVSKEADELACLRAAVAAVSAAMAAAAGATTSEIRARLASAVVAAGATLPHEGTCAVLEEDAPLRRLPADRPIAPGDVVAIDLSAAVDGYEAGAGRTAGGSPQRWEELRARLVARCRAGAHAEDLSGAAAGFGLDPDLPLAYGYGFGPEPPLATGDELHAGDVIAIQARGWERGGAGWFGRDMVLVGDDEGTLLTAEIPL